MVKKQKKTDNRSMLSAWDMLPKHYYYQYNTYFFYVKFSFSLEYKGLCNLDSFEQKDP